MGVFLVPLLFWRVSKERSLNLPYWGECWCSRVKKHFLWDVLSLCIVKTYSDYVELKTVFFSLAANIIRDSFWLVFTVGWLCTAESFRINLYDPETNDCKQMYCWVVMRFTHFLSDLFLLTKYCKYGHSTELMWLSFKVNPIRNHLDITLSVLNHKCDNTEHKQLLKCVR